MKWMAGWLLYFPCRLIQAFIQAGECSTLLQQERTGFCKFNRNETELPTNQLGEEGWPGLGSVPFRCRAHRPWWWWQIYSYPGKPRQRNSVFPFAPPAMSIRFVPFLFNFFRLTYHHCLCQKQLPVNFNVTLLRVCSVCIVHVIILLIHPLPILPK